MTDSLDYESRIDITMHRMHRADVALKEAECLASNSMFSGAVNRLYYACYYAVSALLLANDIQAATHSGVKTMFGLKFVRTGKVELCHGKFFSEIFDQRHSSDYDDFSFCDDTTFSEFHPKAVDLIKAIKDLIDKTI